jgi:NADH-quinone oxidoreductase subunit G
VGALTTKDFRFKIRVWFLEDVPGVCTGCSNGCNIHLGTANNKVYRYVPRRNDAVNETWICDEGRLSYKAIGAADRLDEIVVRHADGHRETVRRDQGITLAAARLRALVAEKGPGVVAGVASPHATNEDLFVLRRLLEGLGVTNDGCAVPRGRSDDLLIKAEKAANGAGARALGFEDAEALLDRLRGGGLEGLIVLGHELLGEGLLAGDLGPLEALDTVILLDTHHSELERVAHLVFPARHAAEKLGTLTNHAGRVQRVVPAVEPSFEAYAEGEILSRLGAALDLPGFEESWDPRAVSKQLAQESASFAGCDLDSVGDLGRTLGGGDGP